MKRQVIFSGGIGNQMFEYVFLLFLKNNNIDAAINANMYQYMQMHNGYILNKAFGIEQSQFLKNSKCASVFIYSLVRFHPKFLVFSENNMSSDKIQEILKSKQLFFNGCWINPVYCAGLEDVVRKSFTFRNLDKWNLEMGKSMSTTNSVSIHIRRGDYLKIQHLSKVFCDEYYYNAVNMMNENLSSPKFYVFSDDPDWCVSFMKNFDVEYMIISQNKGEDSYKDMYLMSKCKHNIIANSTFSWWGAWLNNNKEKIVICPKIWTRGRTFNPCPEEWVHI